jgi:DNA-binding transcriptional MerR regulator
MKIGELSRRTAIPTRMLRYYGEQRLLHPDRSTTATASLANRL